MRVQEKKSDVDIRQIYKMLYSWHQANKHRSNLPPLLQKKYLNLIRELPEPEEACDADILFLCNEIHDGLMAWSRNEKIDHGDKIADLVEKITKKLGGALKIHSIAAKSKMARKYWPRIKLLENLLQLLTTEELRQLYIKYGEKPIISKAATKNFILRKVIEEIPSTHLFGDPKISYLLSLEFEGLYSFLKDYLLDLDKTDLEKICEDLGQIELPKKYKSKSKLISQLMQNVPLYIILGSNILKRKLRKEFKLIREIRKLESDIQNLARNLQKMEREEFEQLLHLEEMHRKFQESLKLQERELKTFLTMKASPQTMKFLEIFRKELISLGEPISPQKLCQVIEKTQDALQTNELIFILKGLEILLTHYFWKHVKNMEWLPDFQEFIHIIREEIPKIQILPNQAEIPTLRERVTRRLGISDSIFDNQLILAWKKGFVKLDVGAPIGRNNVKYLKYGQSEYFYVKLL